MENEFENKAEEIVEEPAQESVQESAQEQRIIYTDYIVQEPVKPVVKEKKGTGKRWLTCIAMAAVFGVVASATFFCANTMINRVTNRGNSVTYGSSTDSNKEHSSVGSTNVSINTESTVDSDVAKVAENVMPSVVAITNLSVQEVQSFFYGSHREEVIYSGSGIIIGQNDSELLLVTNHHVVDASTELTVTFHDEESVKAYVKGAEPNIDIAVIAVSLSDVKEETLSTIKVATLGNSDAISVGEPAIAIGNALGYGQSVTYGIVSALGREIEDLDTQLIQTDAAINPGNSGGALLNANGEVIGINTAKVQDTAIEGMGYAIPISDVNDVINELMNREVRNEVETSKRGTLGIQGISVSEDVSELYGIPQGVQIAEVLEGGAASKAKLPRKGIITKFDGLTINSMEDLTDALKYYAAGEEIEIVVATPDETGEYVEKTYKVTLSGQSVLKDQ